MTKLIFIFLILTSSVYAGTALNAQNVLGHYDMQGVVHLRANLLAKNKIKATQVGIVYDTDCSGSYQYDPTLSMLQATLNCDGDRLFQKINLKDKTLEDLEAGTTVNVYLEYKSDKYNFDFEIIKEQSFQE